MNSQHDSFLVDVESVQRRAEALGLSIPTVIWDEACPSTNDELAALVRSEPAPAEFTVRGTDFQNAGHGRLGRTWTVPARKSLTFSILLKPGAVFGPSLGWIPLLAGEAVRAAIAEAGVPAVLKWPNDVLTVDGKKLCGILARIEALASGPHIVLGMGLNTRLEVADLPRETASSIAIELGRTTDSSAATLAQGTDHGDLLVAILSRLIPSYRELVEYEGHDFSRSRSAEQVRSNMVTLGAQVRVERPDGSSFIGRATGLDSGGDLIIDNDTHISAGDVHHLRMAND